MVKYILKRIGLSILILIGVSMIIYALIRFMPTNYIDNLKASLSSNPSFDPSTLNVLAEELGLDDNSFGGIVRGYFNWLLDLFRLDFGNCFTNGQLPVTEVIIKYMPNSFFIALIATIFEFMIAIPLGVTAATHQYSIRDYTVTILVMIGISMPSFFLGQVFKFLLAEPRGWFHPGGEGDIANALVGIDVLLEYFKTFFLPILTVVVLSIGGRMRMTRTNMLEVLNADYIRTARAKGLKESKVIYKHAFRNTLIPLVTSLAGLLPSLFSGAIITEQVFDISGIGNVAYKAMMQGDIPFIMGYNMFLAMLSVIGVLLADLMYAVVDPRVKLTA